MPCVDLSSRRWTPSYVMHIARVGLLVLYLLLLTNEGGEDPVADPQSIVWVKDYIQRKKSLNLLFWKVQKQDDGRQYTVDTVVLEGIIGVAWVVF